MVNGEKALSSAIMLPCTPQQARLINYATAPSQVKGWVGACCMSAAGHGERTACLVTTQALDPHHLNTGQ